MSAEVTGTMTSSDTEPMQSAVDHATAVLAVEGRLAGPAAVQDDVASLLPVPEPVGAWCELSDGSIAMVLIDPAVAPPGPGGTPEPSAVIDQLTPVLAELATAAGLSHGAVIAIADSAAVPSGAEPRPGVRELIGAGVFDGEQVVASVSVAVSLGATAPGPNAPTARPVVPELPNLGLLVDVALGVTVELGRSTVSMGALLDLRPGSVLELDRAAGSSVDVLVNGTLLGRGEVIVVDNSYAVRITEIVTDGGEP